ncbi:MAG: serine/threonine protein kinase [Desulfobacteraceae bacterium]|nr:serine/threonine protein kinase [Desulfobacteraceae bacterium]
MKYGRYEIRDELGKGNMGVVYRAHDPQIDRIVALKVLRSDRVTSDDFVARFLKEAKAIGRLSHGNIVTVYDVGKDHGTVYIAMEYLRGKPFDQVMKIEKLSIEKIIDIGVQIAETLAYAHDNGIVHRDIKPSNILLTDDGVVKLTDFGIAHIEDPTSTLQTLAGEILGTPVYMSPEQVNGQPVDGRSDLFSLGIILYELCTERRPFTGGNIASIFKAITQDTPESPVDLDPGFPRTISGLIMQMVEKVPGKRIQSGETVAAKLRDYLKNEERGRDRRKPGKKTGLIPMIAGVIVLVLAAAWGYQFLPTSPQPPVITDYTAPVDANYPGIKTFNLPEGTEVVNPGPSPQEISELSITSRPDGAQIFLDNAFKGKTPMDFKLPYGKYEVRLTLPNHYEWEAQIQLDEPGNTPLFIRLISMD